MEKTKCTKNEKLEKNEKMRKVRAQTQTKRRAGAWRGRGGRAEGGARRVGAQRWGGKISLFFPLPLTFSLLGVFSLQAVNPETNSTPHVSALFEPDLAAEPLSVCVAPC